MNHKAKQMFGHMMAEHARKGRGRGRGFRRARYNVPVNIIEHDTEFELWVYAFNFPKEHIKVSVVEDTLYISGSREPADAHPNWLLQEFPIKGFERSFELSHYADKNNIRAVHQDGILKVYVGKTAEAKHPEISVEIQ